MYKAHELDAGYDLVATHDATVYHHSVTAILTGETGSTPPGMVGLVCPRSGLAMKHGVTVVNAPGILDAGYTGEIVVLLSKFGDEPYFVEKGDRIAQLVHVPLGAFTPGVESQRGTAGIGSSGTD